MMRVRTRAQHMPRVGDKLSSRHGLNGVDRRGAATGRHAIHRGRRHAHLIMNPHTKPSRMTIGQLLKGRGLLGQLIYEGAAATTAPR
mmetsp:Transcript_25451/g.80382  ORF Transcript_25451/g.80382 Transcript_25451/m.80382 type:complete len:87 (+) Transcript_25451:224-484(+)